MPTFFNLFAPTFQRMKATPVLLIGITFVIVNAFSGALFYHVNTYKLFLFSTLLSGLWVYFSFTKVLTQSTVKGWLGGGLLFLLTLVALPGGWLFSDHNVYFPIELITDMLCVAWAVLLLRHITHKHAQQGLLYWVGLCVLMVFIQVLADYVRVHPLNGEWVLLGRPDGSFGNVNYMSGFMGVLIPVFFMLSLPRYDGSWRMSKEQKVFCGVWVLGLVAIMLGQTRSALATTVLACLLCLFIYAMLGTLQVLKKTLLRVVLWGLVSLVLFSGVVVLWPNVGELILPQRFYNLFDISAWWSRLMPLQGALNAFLASPWLGWGLGSSYNLNFLHLPTDIYLYTTEYSYNHVHNELMEMAEDGGILGLLTWAGVFGYVIVQLIRYAKQTLDPFQQLLAVGIVGSIVSFYGHGMFSVAQRMVVTNMPLYLMLGLGLGLIFHAKPTPAFLTGWQQKLSWLRVWHVMLVWFGVLWWFFVPWLVSFYGLTKNIENKASLAVQYEHLKEWPNPYGLDSVFDQLSAQKQIAQALVVAAQIDSIIPQYRHISYRKGILYFMQGDYKQAQHYGLLQQQLNTYFQPNLMFLFSLAVLLEDEEQVSEQLGHILQSLLLRSDSLDELHSRNHVRWQVSKHSNALSLIENDGVLIVQLPQVWVKELVAEPNKVETFVQVSNRILSQLASNEWFIPNVSAAREVQVLLNQHQALLTQTQQQIAKDTDTYFSKYTLSLRSAKQQYHDLAVIREYAANKVLADKRVIKERLDQLVDEVTAQQLIERWETLHGLLESMNTSLQLLKFAQKHAAEKSL